MKTSTRSLKFSEAEAIKEEIDQSNSLTKETRNEVARDATVQSVLQVARVQLKLFAQYLTHSSGGEVQCSLLTAPAEYHQFVRTLHLQIQ